MAGRGGTVMSGALEGLGAIVRGTLELGRNGGVETMKVNVAPVIGGTARPDAPGGRVTAWPG